MSHHIVQAGLAHRVLDVDCEDFEMRSPIDGLDGQPLLSFKEITDAALFIAKFPGFAKFTYAAIKAGRQKVLKAEAQAHGLSEDDIAMIFLCAALCGPTLSAALMSMAQVHAGEPVLPGAEQVAARPQPRGAEDRVFPCFEAAASRAEQAAPAEHDGASGLVFPDARRKLLKPRQVYRGVKLPLGKKYSDQIAVDPEIIWCVRGCCGCGALQSVSASLRWAFSSTTKSMDVLNNEMFCGTKGARTVFKIAITSGFDIKAFSSVVSEDEVGSSSLSVRNTAVIYVT
jgi:hypothetical protein